MQLLTVTQDLQCELQLAYNISESPITTMVEFLDRATKFINSKEMNHPAYRTSALSDKSKKYERALKPSYSSFSTSSKSVDPHQLLQKTRTNILIIL